MVLLLAFVLFVVFAIGIPLRICSDGPHDSPHRAAPWTLVAFFGRLLGLPYVVGGREGTSGSAVQY